MVTSQSLVDILWVQFSYLSIILLRMKHLIKIKNSTFSVSNSVVSAITKNNLNFQVINHKEKQIHLLDDSCLSSFTTVPTTSQTHFYIKFRKGSKSRVSKLFFEFIVLSTKQGLRTVEKTQNTRTAMLLSLDKFYTKPEVSDLCVNVFSSNIKIKEQDLIVEPSAGDGSFIKALKNFNCNKIFLDIAPENKQIKQANFLEWQPPKIKGKIHVIGNPPFGKQSSLCLKFIKHASKFADSVSFILPPSFKKQSLVSKIPKNFHLVKELVIEKNAFTFGGKNFDLPTVFQVWQKQENLRIEPVKESAKGFSFVDPSQANIAITRVGTHTGKIWLISNTNLLELSKTTHFFINSDNNLVNLLKGIKQIKCESVNWVIGPMSLAKTKLISILNKIQEPDVIS